MWILLAKSQYPIFLARWTHLYHLLRVQRVKYLVLKQSKFKSELVLKDHRYCNQFGALGKSHYHISQCQLSLVRNLPKELHCSDLETTEIFLAKNNGLELELFPLYLWYEVTKAVLRWDTISLESKLWTVQIDDQV